MYNNNIDCLTEGNEENSRDEVEAFRRITPTVGFSPVVDLVPEGNEENPRDGDEAFRVNSQNGMAASDIGIHLQDALLVKKMTTRQLPRSLHGVPTNSTVIIILHQLLFSCKGKPTLPIRDVEVACTAPSWPYSRRYLTITEMEEDCMILRIPESTTKKILKKGMKEMERQKRKKDCDMI
ncbi:hypothetical protein P5673_017783 [Acropora cervicornis]|uniref:Uncharacterized protein n=1 Tax=Acropora cervicornis TaxID=6130 RepID=A0AAD9QEF1_ACRCE|nr:hypothetical protein P5673_017783 [Acropora cervicornis]